MLSHKVREKSDRPSEGYTRRDTSPSRSELSATNVATADPDQFPTATLTLAASSSLRSAEQSSLCKWYESQSVPQELVVADLGASAPTLGWLLFAAASFLVSVPVFVQAPLVRQLPLLSLVMTLGWVWLGLRLLRRPTTQVWGDLLLGFSWSWLAGSIYWGWLRWEPLVHLPIEAIGLPFALWGLWRGWGKIGNLFYLGSLFGTALTDVYFYLTDLIPHWRQVMQVEPSLAAPIFQSAIARVQTPWGITLAIVLISTLGVVGLWSLARRQLHWWAFSGAVLSTILVDSLFWLAASMA